MTIQSRGISEAELKEENETRKEIKEQKLVLEKMLVNDTLTADQVKKTSEYQRIQGSVDRKEKNAPVQTLVERYTQLAAVRYVDEIIPYQSEDDLIDILKMYDLDIRIIGDEYKDKTFTGRATCASQGIEVYFNKRDHRFSTSDLRKRVTEENVRKV